MEECASSHGERSLSNIQSKVSHSNQSSVKPDEKVIRNDRILDSNLDSEARGYPLTMRSFERSAPAGSNELIGSLMNDDHYTQNILAYEEKVKNEAFMLGSEEEEVNHTVTSEHVSNTSDTSSYFSDTSALIGEGSYNMFHFARNESSRSFSSDRQDRGEYLDNMSQSEDNLKKIQTSNIINAPKLSLPINADTSRQFNDDDGKLEESSKIQVPVQNDEENFHSSLLHLSSVMHPRNNQSSTFIRHRYNRQMNFCIIIFLSGLLTSSIIGIVLFTPSQASPPLILQKGPLEPSHTPTPGPSVMDPFSNKLWIEIASVQSLDAGDEAGDCSSMSYDGQRLVVGARKYSNHRGIVRIFDIEENQSGSYEWKKSAALQGTTEGDRFGDAVSLSGDGNR